MRNGWLVRRLEYESKCRYVKGTVTATQVGIGVITRPLTVLLLEVVVDLLVLVAQISPGGASNIPAALAFEVSHVPQSVCANDDAPSKISRMSVTLETSHLEMSLLNDDAW